MLLTLFAIWAAFSSLIAKVHLSEDAEDACKRIVSDKVFATDPILCIGQLKSSILVVTKALAIWQLSGASLSDTSLGKLYFGKHPPVPIESKWPAIADDPTFRKLKASGIPSCNTAVDEAGEYLLLDSSWNSTVGGLVWDFTKQEALVGMQNVHKDGEVRWISSTSMNHYYCLTSQEGGGLAMVQYQFCQCSGEHCSKKGACSAIRQCSGMGPVGPGGVCLDPFKPSFRRVCMKGSKSLYVQKEGSGKSKCKAITWKVYNGFVDSGIIYLFAEDSVWSFPEKAYESAAPVVYHGQKWSSFIECGAGPSGRDVVGGKSGITMGVIVAAVLMLVLLCLCGLLCLYREAIARRQRGSKKGGKNAGVGNLIPFIGAGGGGGGKSARSGGPLGFGLISAKKKKSSRKSKRSTAGLVPAGDISKKKKGVGVGGSSSKKTKRSVAANTGGVKSISRKAGARATGTSAKSSKSTAGGGGRHQVTQRSGKISGKKASGKSSKSTGKKKTSSSKK